MTFVLPPLCPPPAHSPDDADDDEAQEQQRRKQAAMPKGNFNDILQKASELKAAQMKDKRRAWEATPEFMKNTMVREGTLASNFLFFHSSFINRALT